MGFAILIFLLLVVLAMLVLAPLEDEVKDLGRRIRELEKKVAGR